jgi:hypothetical protein
VTKEEEYNERLGTDTIHARDSEITTVYNKDDRR